MRYATYAGQSLLESENLIEHVHKYEHCRRDVEQSPLLEG